MAETIPKGAKEAALKAAEEAGKILRESFGRPYWVRDKAPGETLTEIDLRAEKAILGIIRKEFPEHAVLSEEAGASGKSEWLWVIDPLDGTTNYSINNPVFNTSISLARNKEPLLAVTHAPMTGEVFSAVKGEGAFLNGKPVRVSEEADLGKLMLAFCNGKSREDRKEIGRIYSILVQSARDFDRYKAAALELAFVAAGRLGAFLSNNQKTWDSSAGALLVREAGGKVTDFHGRHWDLNCRDILASNGRVHQELLDKIKEARNQSKQDVAIS